MARRGRAGGRPGTAHRPAGSTRAGPHDPCGLTSTAASEPGPGEGEEKRGEERRRSGCAAAGLRRRAGFPRDFSAALPGHPGGKPSRRLWHPSAPQLLRATAWKRDKARELERQAGRDGRREPARRAVANDKRERGGSQSRGRAGREGEGEEGKEGKGRQGKRRGATRVDAELVPARPQPPGLPARRPSGVRRNAHHRGVCGKRPGGGDHKGQAPCPPLQKHPRTGKKKKKILKNGRTWMREKKKKHPSFFSRFEERTRADSKIHGEKSEHPNKRKTYDPALSIKK